MTLVFGKPFYKHITRRSKVLSTRTAQLKLLLLFKNFFTKTMIPPSRVYTREQLKKFF